MSQEATSKYPFPAVTICHPISWKWPALNSLWQKFDTVPMIGQHFAYMSNFYLYIKDGTKGLGNILAKEKKYELEKNQSIIGFIEKHLSDDRIVFDSSLWLHFLTFHYSNDFFKYAELKEFPFKGYLLELKIRMCEETCPLNETIGK